ncbi:RING-type domain-containing protein [Mycena indigotica]|uniref:RING-type domain-containing protein n=1 Tax=Mycena indigotica TaxID=2126181 RepID=A0A8H6T1H1_9AGAR|nr:RING-type domain-containing protein [Mycena indigotica]KAF7309306.1 RING-type domain-containing protein [Mycena indigotica]
MASPRKAKKAMKLAMPTYAPEVEYSLNLGAESDYSRAATPQPSDGEGPVTRRRKAVDQSQSREQRMRLSTAYDEKGHLKIAERGRREALLDCGICDETAVDPVRTECCRALFCREHIDAWIYGPAATGLCPSCEKPCVVSHNTSSSSPSRTPSLSPSRSRTPTRPATKLRPKYRQSLVPGFPELMRVLCGIALLVLLGVLSRRYGAATTSE